MRAGRGTESEDRERSVLHTLARAFQLDNFANLAIHSMWTAPSLAALEHNDPRLSNQTPFVFHIHEWNMPQKSAAMQKKPFPKLTHRDLSTESDDGPVLPDSFLGGIAPHLRSIYLSFIHFPGLPNLLLSATHLVILELSNITHSGYIPPEAMTTSLSALTGLEFPRLQFLYSPAALETRRSPLSPLRRSILPILTTMLFAWVSGYLEEIYHNSPSLSVEAQH